MLKSSRGYMKMPHTDTDGSVYLLLCCSSHVGSWGHRCGRSGSGGMLDFLRFQEMLWEEEEAQDSEGEEGWPSQKGKGRRGRERREGMSLGHHPALVWVL